MGRTSSWVGFRTSPAEALAKLQLAATGEFHELPEAPLCAVTLESGWFVVVSSADFRFVERARLEDLSLDCELIGTAVDEHAMVSQALAYRNSTLEWSVIHDGSVGRAHLQMEGAPPREVHGMTERARAKRQPGVDHVFGVPVDLVAAVMGFDLSAEHRFETLVPSPAPWRAYRHPDGRVWSIRVGGPGYQLRIGAPDDEPVLKERASTRPLRDLEALIAEQVADGFAPMPSP
jgi:hypothetical protein